MDAERPGPRRSDAEGRIDGASSPRRVLFGAVASAGMVLLATVAWWALGRFHVKPMIEESLSDWQKPAEHPVGLHESTEPLEPEVAPASRSAVEVAPDGAATLDATDDARGHVRCTIRCEVVSAAGPIAGATVELLLERGGRQTPLADVTTGSDGRADTTIESSAFSSIPQVARARIGVVGIARAARHHSRVVRGTFAPPDLACSLLFELEVGAAVRGRVVDPRGAPVANAAVQALLPSNDGLSLEVPGLLGTHSDARGAFELPIDDEERWRVHASASGVGTALSSAFDVTPTVDVDLPDLALASRGFVGGRAVDRRGRPLAGVVVDAKEEGRVPLDDLVQIALQVGADGLRTGRATSSSDGSFRIDGLATGSYRLATPHERSTEVGGARPHELGDTSAELVIERHRLRVVVVDDEGAPLPEADCLYRCGERMASVDLDGDGAFTIDGRAGEQVSATAMLAGCVSAEGEHHFGDDDEEAELRLVLRPIAAATGALALTIVDEQGEPLEPATLTLLTPRGGAMDGWHRRKVAATGRLEQVPAGRWRIEVIAGPSLAGPMIESSLWFPATADVVVRAGATTPVTLRLRAGGRLRFTIRMPADASTAGLADARLDRVPTLPAPPQLGVVYRVNDDGTVQFGACDFVSDVAFLSAPLLETGVHRLRFTAPGFLPIEQSFTIRAGQITDVDLLLEPE